MSAMTLKTDETLEDAAKRAVATDKSDVASRIGRALFAAVGNRC